MIYIYALICPESNEPRYIGKANNPSHRFSAHISAAKTGVSNTHCGRWIRTILAKGLKPIMKILCELPDGADWKSAEMKQIELHKSAGHKLTNRTDGGDGTRYPTPEAIRNHSMALKKRWADPAMREKYREARIASWKDPETRERYLQAVRNPERIKKYSGLTKLQWQDPEFVAKQSQRVCSDETKKKMSAKQKQRWVDNHDELASAVRIGCSTPEYKAKISAKMKEVNSRPEVKARLSAVMKRCNEKRFANPIKMAAHRAKSAEVGARPEVKKRKSDFMKAVYVDPVQSAKRRMSAANPATKAKQSEAAKRRWAEYRAKRKTSL